MPAVIACKPNSMRLFGRFSESCVAEARRRSAVRLRCARTQPRPRAEVARPSDARSDTPFTTAPSSAATAAAARASSPAVIFAQPRHRPLAVTARTSLTGAPAGSAARIRAFTSRVGRSEKRKRSGVGEATTWTPCFWAFGLLPSLGLGLSLCGVGLSPSAAAGGIGVRPQLLSPVWAVQESGVARKPTTARRARRDLACKPSAELKILWQLQRQGLQLLPSTAQATRGSVG